MQRRQDVTRYFMDFEFMEHRYTPASGPIIEVLSIGIACEDGREYYAENRYAYLNRANDWVRENVFPHLKMASGDKQAAGAITPREIRDQVKSFIDAGEHEPMFWGYYCDYDWVLFCRLFGTMMDLPQGWPKFCMDVKQLAVHLGNPQLPSLDGGRAHHALDDAREIRRRHEFLMSYQWDGEQRGLVV